MARKKPASALARQTRKKRSSSVPGTYRGFSLQHNRFVAHLLRANLDDTVCLEAFEDVGVESVDGNRIAEQSKSFSSQNPVADRSLQLWKTLANWVHAATEGSIDPASTRYVLYSFNTGLGTVAERLHAASNASEAESAIAFIRKHLGFPNDLSDNEETRNHMLTVLDGDPLLVCAILSRFTIESGTLIGSEELESLFTAELISEENRDHVIQWAHGWVKQRIDEQITRNSPCRILKRDFHGALLNHVRTHDRLTILKSYAGAPDQSQIEEELQLRIYVRQLRNIDLDDVDVLTAVNDYLRATVDRTNWSRDGSVTETALQTLADELMQTWRNHRRRVRLAYASHSEAERGQLLYSECIEHHTQLDQLDTPRHFIRGSWHALSDDIEIGWHPRFDEILASKTADAKKKSEEAE